MIRSDLVWRIWQQNPHLHRQEVGTVVHAIFDEIPPRWRAEIASSYANWSVSVKVHEAHTGRNPRTGVLVAVPKRAPLTSGRERR